MCVDSLETQSLRTRSVRKGLAFERAMRVKTYLVEQGVEAKNIRLFYQSHDHMGQPRAEVSWFVSEDAAAKDGQLNAKHPLHSSKAWYTPGFLRFLTTLF